VVDLIDTFITEYGTYNGITRSRLQEQKIVLTRFQTTVTSGRIEEATAKDFENFMLAEITRGLEPSTVVKYGNMLRPFFKWAWRNGHIDAERYMRIADVPNPRKANSYGQPRPYDRKEIQRLWDELNQRWPWGEEKFLKRWRNGRSKYKKIGNHMMRAQIEAMVALALLCGLRRHEVFNIAIEDMRPDNEYIVVRKGKGNKYREVPYPDAARERIGRWLDLRDELVRVEGVQHDSPWLVLSINQPLTVAMKPMRFRRFEEMLRTFGQWEWHRLRHTCATEWLRAGMPIELVQALMGHEDIRLTLRYTKIVGADVVKAAGKHMKNFQRALEPNDEEEA
jgi:integrase/recombinase XerC